jgi:hypothetical protein
MLLFKGDYGPTKLEFPLFGEGSVDRFDTITLRAGANDGYSWDAAYLTEQYTRDEFGRNLQSGTGQAGSHGMFVHLYINGVYWGLYNPAERPDHSFSASYYGGDKDDWDAVHDGSPTNGDRTAWDQMIGRCRAGLSTNEAYQEIQGNNPDGTRNPAYPHLLDVPNYVDYLIVNLWGGNWDWPWKNWWAGRERSAESTGFKFYCWDYENTMGNNRSRSPLDKNALENSFSSAGEPHVYLRENAEYRLLFADRVHRLFFNGGVLTPGSLTPRYAEVAATVETAMIGESARWGDQHYSTPLTQQEWYNERDWILGTYLPQRSGIVLQQFIDANLYPSLAAPVFSQHGGSFPNGFALSMTASTQIYYTLDGSDPREFGTGLVLGSLYEGPILLERTALVKARALNSKGKWSALNEALFVPATPSPLRITEIMYHSRPPSVAESQSGYTAEDFDFIELRNTGPGEIGLAGTAFVDGVAFDFTSSGIASLGPGEYVVVVTNLAAFSERYPDWAEMKIAGEFTFPAESLANGGERLILRDGLQRTILSFAYADDWFPNTDGLGFSLVAVDEDAASDAWGRESAWRPSTEMDGSPGRDDPGPADIPAVVINEALTQSEPPGKDAIELHNPGATLAKIGGWYLTDDRTEPRKFRIPEGTEIAGGGYLVFDEDDFNSDPSDPNSFQLSSLGDEVFVFSADSGGNLMAYSHGFRFGAAETGSTFGRHVISTGEDHFVSQLGETLTTANSGPRVGPVVINEIMFNPPLLDGRENFEDEYLELQNITFKSVPLFDPEATMNTWRVGNGVEYTFAEHTTLGPQERVLIVRFDPEVETARADAFRLRYGVDEGTRIFGPFTGRLENSGEGITLLKPEQPKQPPHPDAGTVPYVLVERADYSSSAPWPTGADGTGQSLQRVVPGEYGNDPVNWRVASPTPGGGNPGVSLKDDDKDGMPDQWEMIYFGGTDVPEGGPADDWDGDGSRNIDEWFARTSPTNASSVLVVSSFAVGTDSTLIITWQSVSGRSYSIVRSTDLSAGFNETEAVDIAATPPENSYVLESPAAERAFYRVVVEK